MRNQLLPFLLILSCFATAQKKERICLKKYRISYLSDTLRETSGLSFLQNKLYTLNDGGNTSAIYQIDSKNGNINTTRKTNITNTDWEAITSDSSFVYLGDFGNNSGRRKDLAIYKTQFKNDSILSFVSKIEFEYEAQTDFNPKNIGHNFDAEAMMYWNGKIHLFSKEWKNKATSHYIVNPNPSEKQKIVKTESFNTKFFVTDAAYFNQKLYLIGYTKKGRCFLVVFKTDNKEFVFNNKYKKYKLGSVLSIGQIEGITVNEKGIYISGEGFFKSIFKVKPALYFIPFNALKDF